MPVSIFTTTDYVDKIGNVFEGFMDRSAQDITMVAIVGILVVLLGGILIKWIVMSLFDRHVSKKFSDEFDQEIARRAAEDEMLNNSTNPNKELHNVAPVASQDSYLRDNTEIRNEENVNAVDLPNPGEMVNMPAPVMHETRNRLTDAEVLPAENEIDISNSVRNDDAPLPENDESLPSVDYNIGGFEEISDKEDDVVEKSHNVIVDSETESMPAVDVVETVEVPQTTEREEAMANNLAPEEEKSEKVPSKRSFLGGLRRGDKKEEAEDNIDVAPVAAPVVEPYVEDLPEATSEENQLPEVEEGSGEEVEYEYEYEYVEVPEDEQVLDDNEHEVIEEKEIEYVLEESPEVNDKSEVDVEHETETQESRDVDQEVRDQEVLVKNEAVVEDVPVSVPEELPTEAPVALPFDDGSTDLMGFAAPSSDGKVYDDVDEDEDEDQYAMFDMNYIPSAPKTEEVALEPVLEEKKEQVEDSVDTAESVDTLDDDDIEDLNLDDSLDDDDEEDDDDSLEDLDLEEKTEEEEDEDRYPWMYENEDGGTESVESETTPSEIDLDGEEKSLEPEEVSVTLSDDDLDANDDLAATEEASQEETEELSEEVKDFVEREDNSDIVKEDNLPVEINEDADNHNVESGEMKDEDVEVVMEAVDTVKVSESLETSQKEEQPEDPEELPDDENDTEEVEEVEYVEVEVDDDTESDEEVEYVEYVEYIEVDEDDEDGIKPTEHDETPADIEPESETLSGVIMEKREKLGDVEGDQFFMTEVQPENSLVPTSSNGKNSETKEVAQTELESARESAKQLADEVSKIASMTTRVAIKTTAVKLGMENSPKDPARKLTARLLGATKKVRKNLENKVQGDEK